MNPKIVIGGLIFAFFAFFLGTFTLPTELHIARGVVIDAAPQTIQPRLVDLRQWDAWAPWGGPASGAGPGATRPWPGGGTMTVVEVEPDGLRYTVDGLPYPAEGKFTITEKEDGAWVVWDHYSWAGYSPPARIAGWVARGRLSQEMGEGLDKLKADVEAR